MSREFKPNQQVLVYSSVAMFVLVTVMFSVVLFSGNSLRASIEAFAILFVPLTAFCASLFFTKVVLSSNTIEVIILFASRHIAKLSDIVSVNHRSTFLGGVDVIELHYVAAFGVPRTLRINLNAYGQQQVSEILAILRRQNPRITFDAYSEKLVLRSTDRGRAANER